MSRALHNVKIGERVFFKGPKGRFAHKQGGHAKIGMLAGGTGITPMYQLIQTILRDANDTTEVSFFFIFSVRAQHARASCDECKVMERVE